VSVSRRPSLAEIAAVLGQLSEHVVADSGVSLDPVLAAAIVRASLELRRHIPGLAPAPDPVAARQFAATARAALASDDGRPALAAAIAGLSRAPHDPELHYLVGSACFELGAVKPALTEIGLALWIHPGYDVARRDLEALSAFWQSQRGRGRRSATPPAAQRKRAKKPRPARGSKSLPFEFPPDTKGEDSSGEDLAA
jgi:hypothetical protein